MPDEPDYKNELVFARLLTLTGEQLVVQTPWYESITITGALLDQAAPNGALVPWLTDTGQYLIFDVDNGIAVYRLVGLNILYSNDCWDYKFVAGTQNTDRPYYSPNERGQR